MIRTKNPGIMEAIRELKEMSMSRPMRQIYEAHLKRARDEKAREQYVRQEGEERMAELITQLLSDGRNEDAALAAKDKEARGRFYREYGMEEPVLK